MLAEGLHRRFLRLAGEIERAGQQYRDRAGGGHRGGGGLISVFQMIRRQRAVLRRQGRAMQVGELVGVQFHRQAQTTRRLEHARRLRRREGDGLAERIHRIGEARFGDGGQHFVAHQADIGVLVAPGFRRQRVRAEKRRGDRHFAFGG